MRRDRLKYNEALVFGVTQAETVGVTTQKRLREHPVKHAGKIARDSASFTFQAGVPGILMLDHDVDHQTTTSYDRDSLRDALLRAVPELATAQMAWAPSASSYIYDIETGEELNGLRGQRLYIVVLDASDIPRLGKVIYERLWAAGLGRYVVSKVGQMMDRNLFDASAWQAERIDFAAGAECTAPLEQRAPSGKVWNGTAPPWDSQAMLANLTAKQIAAADMHRAAARGAVTGEAGAKRTEYIDNRVAARAASDGIGLDEARQRVRAEVELLHLSGDFVLHPEEGDTVTVGQVLTDSKKWNGARFADPIEPEYRNDKRIAWLNMENPNNPFIYSHAHGLAQRYTLGKQQAVSTAQPRDLPSELEPVDALPLDALPDALRPWIADCADRMQCPPDFVALPMLIGAASLVARLVTIRPQANTDWTERANLWGLIVGRPGMMKSPAMGAALAPLAKLEAKAAEEHRQEMKGFELELSTHALRKKAGENAASAALKKDSATDISGMVLGEGEPEPPTRRRYTVNDATYEKLGELLSQNSSGLMVVRDEMKGLLTSLSQEEKAPARAFYLQAWSGGRYVFDRIMRGTTAIDDARLSMVGCIQPGPLSSFVRTAVTGGTADDGMVQRFLICWPDTHGDWRNVDRLPDLGAKRAAHAVFDRLDCLDVADLCAQQDTDFNGEAEGLPYLRFAPDALEVFEKWRADLESKMRSDAIGAATEAALSKFRKHVPALALTLHVVDGHTGPVDLKSTLRALALADYFESHARRTYASAVRPAVATAKAILRKIKTGALISPFTARDVYRPQWERLTDREVVDTGLSMLVTYGHLSEIETLGAGRPTMLYTAIPGAKS